MKPEVPDCISYPDVLMGDDKTLRVILKFNDFEVHCLS
jgi:hypothetical protein